MKSYTIYNDTLDHPGVYCVREWKIEKQAIPGPLLGTANTLEDARKIVPFGLHLIPRSPEDDSKIVETWI